MDASAPEEILASASVQLRIGDFDFSFPNTNDTVCPTFCCTGSALAGFTISQATIDNGTHHVSASQITQPNPTGIWRVKFAGVPEGTLYGINVSFEDNRGNGGHANVNNITVSGAPGCQNGGCS